MMDDPKARFWAASLAGALLCGACADDGGSQPAFEPFPGAGAGASSGTTSVPSTTGATTTGQSAATSASGGVTGDAGELPGATSGAPAGTSGADGLTSGSTFGTSGTVGGISGATTAAGDPTTGSTTGAAGDGGGDTTGDASDAGTLDAGSTGGALDAGTTGGEADAGGTTGMPEPPRKFVGNITTRGRVRDDFVTYWDQITPENEGKWQSTEPTRDQMNWAGQDAAYAYAKQHGIPFKAHTFVWGSQEPSWIAGLPPNEQREEVEEWIRLYCERYPDTEMIDVVNEPPPHQTPSYMEAIGGAGDSGWDWIVQSFQWARQYCPKSILILNDYNTIEYPNDHAHILDVVKRIQAAGAPIDAVGVQAHDAYKIPTDTVRMYLDRIAAETGLPIYVSEYDINVADDDEQRRIMQSQFEMFWNHEHVVGITLWGYIEGATWRPDTGLMSESGQMRPAMAWLVNFLEQNR